MWYSSGVTGARRGLLVGTAAAGYVAALAATHALVMLRYRWVDPAAAAASQGMYAFGDLIAELGVVGVLSLAPTWLLLRALRDVGGFWRLVSWAGLSWALLAPVAIAIRIVEALAGPGSAARAPSLLVAADVFAVLRLLATPAALPGLAIACWACAPGPARRRLLWATGLEASGVAAYALWIGWAILRGRT